jgi:putative ABC transport system permease protein
VISYRVWQRDLGGAPDALGRTVRVNGVPCTVVGVVPRAFSGIDAQPVDLWLPIALVDRLGPGEGWLSSRFASWVTIIARLAPEVGRDEATAFANTLLHDASDRASPTVILGPLNGAAAPEVAHQNAMLLWVTAATLVVLIIACIDVALLLLARGAQRRHELAVRLALGASRSRLVRQLLLESAIIAMLGAAAGLLALLWREPLARLIGLSPLLQPVEARPLLALAGLAMLAALACGVAPAISTTRVQLQTELAGASLRGGGRHTRTRGALIAAQVALSFALSVVATMFLSALHQARRIDVGVDAHHLLVVSTPARGEALPPKRLRTLFEAMRERARTLPGIRSASLAAAVPFQSLMMTPVQPPLETGTHRSNMVLANHVDPGYFETVGTPLVAGRGFAWADTSSHSNVAVISQQLARRLWGTDTPLGECLRVSGRSAPCIRVIGITKDAKYDDLYADPQPIYYLPLRSDENLIPALLVRTTGDPRAMVATVRRSLQGAMADLPYIDVKPFAALLAPQTASLRVGSLLFAGFGLLALVLAGLGLYGLLSYSVASRRAELGVRLALGADGSRLVRLVVVEALRLVAAGIVVGAVLALGLQRFIQASTRVSPLEPVLFAGVAAALIVAAGVASSVPALRAARISPASAMRQA